jgi:ATP-dependent DNA helicase RecG
LPDADLPDADLPDADLPDADLPDARPLRSLADVPVSRLGTVSERRVGRLAEFGVVSVLDLLSTYPRRYIDRTKQADVSDLVVGDEAAVLARVVSSRARRARTGRAVVDVSVQDDTGRLAVVFFNQPWRAKQLAAGTEAIFFGKVGLYRGIRQMVNPVVDVVAASESGRRTLRILPVYPASAKAGLTSWEIGTFVEEALARAGELVDPLPASERASLGLIGRTEAYGAVHRPESLEAVDPARRRLKFDELFRLQLAVVLRRRAFEDNARALRHEVSPLEVTGGVTDTLMARFLSHLPFELTTAQRRALAVVVADMAGPFPMHRLLQGDVGSGKTVVALASLLAAVQSGHQGALMVPTEVLAEQHLAAVRALLGGLEGPGGMAGGEVRVELLTSRVKGRARTGVLEGLARGDIGIVVGTHALLTEEVAFASLGCVVVDEQHRFGVEQRASLRTKGNQGDPDMLVMTATPIPRTAAMVIFGDLDLTVLDELPPGRTPVTTIWLPGADAHAGEEPAWERVRGEVALGHRAFVVCPLVGDSPRVEAKSAAEEFERLSAGELAGLRVGLLHGQMPSAAREEVMTQFRGGDLEVLVATTVIEVGVDVPEATVMVIESADRFGIAQLHQLRGRVGRGTAASWCYLLGGEEGNERLSAVAASVDGFELAEADLRVRGEGTLFGSRQKGQSDLRLASLTDEGDMALLDAARQVAQAIVAEDPCLEAHPDVADEVRVLVSVDEGEFLFKG